MQSPKDLFIPKILLRNQIFLTLEPNGDKTFHIEFENFKQVSSKQAF